MAKKKSGNNMMGPSTAQERQWQIEDDLRSCQRYLEIQRDPKRKAAVKKLAKERLTELKDLAG